VKPFWTSPPTWLSGPKTPGVVFLGHAHRPIISTKLA